MAGETAETTKTLILECKNNVVRKITVPESWSVTFGPLVPATPRHATEGGTLCLRIYSDRSAKKLEAVFRDVVAFRTEDMPVRERVVKTQSKKMQRKGTRGGRDFTAEVREVVWRDPLDEGDEEDMSAEELLNLPASDDAF